MSPRVDCARPAPGVALLEIRRPEVHNALDRTAQREFDEHLARVDADPEVRAVVLAGAGGRALSAGWDIEEMRALSPADNLALVTEREEWLWRWYTCATPTVAAMRGICFGVGALLAACADLRVGGPGTRFKITGIGYGYANLAWLLPELIGASRAARLLLTGAEVDGAGADRLGLLAELADDDAGVTDAAVALAARVAAVPPAGVRDAKRLVREGAGQDARARYDAENALVRARLSGQSPDQVFAGFTGRRRG